MLAFITLSVAWEALSPLLHRSKSIALNLNAKGNTSTTNKPDSERTEPTTSNGSSEFSVLFVPKRVGLVHYGLFQFLRC